MERREGTATSYIPDKAGFAAHLANNAAHNNVRAATFVLAAVDSDILSIAQSDFQCSGAADNVDLTAALAPLAANGGKIVLLEGNYSFNADVVIPGDDIEIELCRGARIILVGGATCHIFTATGRTGIYIHGGMLDGTGNTTAENELVDFLNCTDIRLEEITLYNTFGNAFRVQTCEQVKLDVYVDTTRGAGHGGGLISNSRFVTGFIRAKDTADSGADINGTAANPCEHIDLHYLVENAGTVAGFGVDIYGLVRNARFDVIVEGSQSDNVHIHTATFDGGTTYVNPTGITLHLSSRNAGRYGLNINGFDDTEYCRDITIYADYIFNSVDDNITINYAEDITLYLGCIDTTGEHGIDLLDIEAITIIGGIVKNSDANGIYIKSGVIGYTITGGHYKDNGQDGGLAAGIRCGIAILAGSEGLITGIKANNEDGATQQYGINSGADLTSVKGCDTRGNALMGVRSTQAICVFDKSPISVEMDLSNVAEDFNVFNAIVPCQIVGYQVVWIEAAGDANTCDIRVGEVEDDGTIDVDEFDIYTTAGSETLGQITHLDTDDMIGTTIEAGHSVTVGHTQKTGAGVVRITLQIVELSD